MYVCLFVFFKRLVNLVPLSVVVGHQFIENQFPRSSSGFCEKFAGHGGSDPGQAEDSRSAHIVDSASCFLDLNSNGDLVTRALADLDLSSSIELVSAGGYNYEYQHSIISYDTAELLRTPSPCMVESDQEAEPVETENAGVEARDGSSEENIEKHQGKQDQCAALNHKENGHGFCMQINSGIQPVADVPATSTPKKQKALSSDSPQIVEGRYKGSAYHRDGTRVGGDYNFFKFFHSKSRDCVTYRKKDFSQYFILSRCAV